MHRRLAPALLIVALSVTLCPADNCLWKATSDKGTLYLLGSVHMLKATDYPLDSAIMDAYMQSDALVFETDINQMLAPASQALLYKKAELPEGKTLQGELDADVYALLTEKLADAGLPPDSVQSFKPWFATMLLTVARLQAMGLDPALGIDQYFHRKALADGKTEIGLESIEFQINLFDALSDGNQNAFTQHALKEIEQMETMFDDMQEAWKTGNLAKLDAMVRDSFDGYPKMYAGFVSQRNQRWVNKLEQTGTPDTTRMVIVGTAHLGGKEGLLELLKAKGYSLEQL